MSDNGKKPYQVGYGKPPLHSRYQPGQSGNPRGRPKRAEADDTLDAALRRAAARKVTVNTPRGPRQIKWIDAVAFRVVRDAANGDRFARRDLTNALPRAETASSTKQQTGVMVLYEPARTIEEWAQKYSGQQVPLDPLEGLPGIDPKALRRQPRPRGATPEEEEDEDET